MDGVLVIDKEQNFTSFDVVAKLRGILRMKKIGHGGTLDPQATGVLPVFLGSATKLCDYLPDETKVYEAEIFFGRTTDTGDVWGETISECLPDCREEEVRDAILSFIGSYEQVPPMVSAKKVNGKKLYELARKGLTIEREPVSLHIHDIRILSVELPRVRFVVDCEKGTYIRTLCEDIGKKLGCGACMSALRRLRHGAFRIENARTLREIEDARDRGLLESLILPVESVLPFPDLTVPKDFVRLLQNGNRMTAEGFPGLIAEEEYPDGRYKMRDETGTFYGVYRMDFGSGTLLPEKMFLKRE